MFIASSPLLFVLFLAIARLVSSTSSAPVVDLGYAQYQGSLDLSSNITQFLGIRFAAPPTGSLRWQEPHQPGKVSGIQLANSQPPTCLQATTGGYPVPTSKIPASEDCLFLNVWTPGTLPIRTHLPVVVWIHGGGYHSGGATGGRGSLPYDGQDLIRESDYQVIVVVIQYRLGLWGFLSGSKVKAGGVLNAGLLDQQFALRWVHKHIAQFGGDPTRVTIWGESAGAGSVLQHVVANNGFTDPPLFRGAISSSNFLPSQHHYSDIIPETLYSEVVAQADCTAFKDTLDCLRSSNSSVLQVANNLIAEKAFFGTYVWVPVIDGSFIVQRPSMALKEGKVNGDVLLAVTNAFEGVTFVSPNSTQTVPEFITSLFPGLGHAQVAAAADHYAGLGTSKFQKGAIAGESTLICPTYYMLAAFHQESYKGEFAVPPAKHASDVIYYFPSLTVAGPPYKNASFVKAFSKSFLDFAISLDPNEKFEATMTPQWKPWSMNQSEMLFNKTDENESVVHPISTSVSLMERCSFWQSVSHLTAQ